jgi:hydrogenase maturation protease
MKKPVAVLGLGNPLMADEGIGVALVERLGELAEPYPSVDFLDAGTGGMAVLHLIEDRRKVIFVDCAVMGEAPGTIRRFTPEQVRSTKVLAHQSLHEADLIQILTLAEKLGQCPEQTVIFGIQPETVSPRQSLSDALLGNMDRYIDQITSELSE